MQIRSWLFQISWRTSHFFTKKSMVFDGSSTNGLNHNWSNLSYRFFDLFFLIFFWHHVCKTFFHRPEVYVLSFSIWSKASHQEAKSIIGRSLVWLFTIDRLLLVRLFCLSDEANKTTINFLVVLSQKYTLHDEICLWHLVSIKLFPVVAGNSAFITESFFLVDWLLNILLLCLMKGTPQQSAGRFSTSMHHISQRYHEHEATCALSNTKKHTTIILLSFILRIFKHKSQQSTLHECIVPLTLM